ncbi:hypothetical protein LAZ40_10960 [Cereibacter sphaeroides]|uniref:hypothetical protein n=1 Tax=Cereibacter sphaeroides TaxID=1063 RepID=UPI001F17B51A|nr:hypothetical protein [Cereibacter sphaeroides]MCE6959575.1 hypothetical protein [Cereibacter sphaeroides]MCE6974565.1 hypothetical protein [Cereibacter sphaeroides]
MTGVPGFDDNIGGDAQPAFADRLKAKCRSRFGSVPDDEMLAHVHELLRAAPGRTPGPRILRSWWDGVDLPGWQHAVQLGIVLGCNEDWLAFPDSIEPRHPETAICLFRAAQCARGLPGEQNLLTWLLDQLVLRGVEVTRPGVVNWMTGAARPRPAARRALESIFNLAPNALELPEDVVGTSSAAKWKPQRARPAAERKPAAQASSPRARSEEIGRLIREALKQTAGAPGDAAVWPRYLQRELMNRFLLNVRIRDIRRWLNGMSTPPADELEALRKILRITV